MTIPQPPRKPLTDGVDARATLGSRICLKTPRLRAPLGFNLTAAAGRWPRPSCCRICWTDV
ncbi:MAG: hypothetical protein CMJ17_03635 [Phenylobacterium sp.]|nr:hypothetical protein [Phenylobacterium sp.]